jgi:hypothetical protein
MSLEIFNTIVGLISLIIGLFAVTKIYILNSRINSNNKLDNHSSITNSKIDTKGDNNTISGRDINL